MSIAGGAPEFRLSVERATAAWVTLRAAGSLTAATVGLLLAIVDYQRRCGCRQIQVDLSDTTLIDIDALTALRDAYQRLRRDGADLRVDGARPHIMPGYRPPAGRWEGVHRHRRAGPSTAHR